MAVQGALGTRELGHALGGFVLVFSRGNDLRLRFGLADGGGDALFEICYQAAFIGRGDGLNGGRLREIDTHGLAFPRPDDKAWQEAKSRRVLISRKGSARNRKG
jgi:hypothetical protein